MIDTCMLDQWSIDTRRMSISLTTEEDVPQLVPLVNVAYRGLPIEGGSKSERDSSWTNEAEIVEGPRVNTEDPRELRNKENVNILKFQQEGKILGCIRLQKNGDTCYIGMLSVHPEAQGKGIGSKLLEFSEDWALNTFKCSIVQMRVISMRDSLIDYYKRRGYTDTGIRQDFPLRKGSGVPKIPIDLAVLEKIFVVNCNKKNKKSCT